MKKIITASLLFAIALSAGAQNMYDAMNFSQNVYYGTARSMGLGNAVTAIGGDLGTIGINPAGSVVSGYDQIVITPGLTISSIGASYSPSGESSYGPVNMQKGTRFIVPNVGFSMSFDTGNRVGLKRMTFAFTSNRTNDFNGNAFAFGANNASSRLAEFATAAWGWDENALARYSSFTDSDVPWDVLTAYQAGLFGSYERGEYGGYVGNTEVISADGSYHYVPGALNQQSSTFKSGYKNDVVLNFAMNFSDRFYAGINIGIPDAHYRYDEAYAEAPQNPEMFPISFAAGDTYFRSGSFDYQYVADMTGIYGKLGFIYLPTDNLRIGAAIQTPTALTIRESWQYGASSSYADSEFNGDQISPEGDYEYGLTTPYSVNAGVAYTFGSFGFISVDYEMMDYSVMKFHDIYHDGYFGDLSAGFYDVNTTMKNFCGVSHSLRLGAELRVTPEFSVRAGYGFITTPERHWTSTSGKDITADDFISVINDDPSILSSLATPLYYKDRTSQYSIGFGYSSPGSFFADVAARMTTYPSFVMAPYYDYDGWDSFGEYGEITAPRVLNDRSKFDVSLTIGWRF